MKTIITLTLIAMSLSACNFFWFDLTPSSAYQLEGQWKLLSVSGGFSGGGWDADFNELHLSFSPDSIYSLWQSDTLIREGFVSFQVMNNQRFLYFTAVTDDIYPWDITGAEKKVIWQARDTLKLNDYCLDCYDYLFARIK